MLRSARQVQRSLAGARDEPKAGGHERDGLLDRVGGIPSQRLGAFDEERHLPGR